MIRVAWLVLVCFLTAATVPTVEEITPRTGGEARYWTADYSLIVGESWTVGATSEDAGEIINWRTWLWTPATKTVWLDAIVAVPEYCRPESVRLDREDYRLLMISCPEQRESGWPYSYHSYLVRLPRDARDWFAAGDMDRDGDIDQTDFGYFQCCLSGPGIAPMPDCWAADLDCDRDADKDDTERMVALMMGAK